MKNIILNQRRATKKVALKRFKKLGLESALNYINKLSTEFNYNVDYYDGLKTGLIRLSKKEV